MRTRSSSNLIVESSTTPKRRNRRRSKQRVEPFSLEETSIVTMVDQRTMAKLLQAPIEGYGDGIVIPAILAENFKLRHGLLNLVTSKQFYGFEKEDPHTHICWFNKITSTIKYKDVPTSSIKLMLFPFSIEGTARIWLEKEPPRSILTWEDLVSNEAWDRFKDLRCACPHHGFMELHQLDTFYNALNPTDQDSLNAAAGGNLLTKTPRDALTIIENKSKVRNSRNKPVVSKVSTNTSSTTACPSKMAGLTDVVNAMLRHVKTSPPETVKAISESCVTCRGLHPYYEYLAADSNTFNASAAATTYNQNQGCRPQGDPNYRASNQIGPPVFPPVQNNQNRFNQNHGYNQNWGNNFNQGNQNYQAPPQVRPSNNLSSYMKTNDVNIRVMQNRISNTRMELKKEMDTTLTRQNNAFKNELKNELTNDINNMMSSFFQMNTASSSGSGSLPSNTVANPRGDLKAIITRSGISYNEPPISPPFSPLPKVVEQEPKVTKDTTDRLLVHLVLPKMSFLKVGKFHFLADFVVVDYVVDPRVPLILGRPFLRTARALIDVYGEELTLRVDDEAITFKVSQTSRYSYNDAESVNRIDFIDVSYSTPPGIDDADFDPEGDILLLEKLLNDDPSSPLPLKELHFEEIKTIKSSIDDPP
ncbi:reverse transcriptase domain-containing protein [Tanacetum coccineum]